MKRQGFKKEIQHRECLDMTSTETMESMFQLQGEIDMLNERVHKLEKMFELIPVKVVTNPNGSTYTHGQVEYTYDEYMSKKDIEITNAQPYKYALDDVVMETFLFHKEARRSRI
jgi:hypothetical protein